MQRLYILDGYGYVFRAFFSLMGAKGRAGVNLSTSWGMPSGALLVYSSMLMKLYREIKPERIAVVFDAPGRTFRKDLDETYKATRRETPEELKPQLPYFSQITEALCWPTLAIEGVEADDVIATLVARARERGWDVVVYTGDKDLMQLVGEGVQVIDSMRDITYDTAAVEQKFGVGPDKLRDYLALVGDSSDNVPGMSGIGKVTATKLLQQYGSIDGILAHVDELKGKQKANFSDPDLLAQLALSRKLVTLKHDVELGIDPDELVPGQWNEARLVELFRKLEFHALLARLSPPASAGNASNADNAGSAGSAAAPVRGEPGTVAAPDIPDPVVATGAEALAPLVAAARSAGTLAVQVETDDARPDCARVIGVALAAPASAPVYIPLAHHYLGMPAQLGVARWPAELLAVLADPEIAVVCHDAKSVVRALARLGVEIAGVRGDTMLAAYLLDPDRDFAIERIMASAAGVSLPVRKSLLGKGKSKIEFENLAVDQAAAYSGKAAAAVLVAHDELRRRLEGAGLSGLMNDLELPLALLLAEVEQHGICLDVPYLQTLTARVSAEIAGLERRIHALAGGEVEVNMGSPKQLSHLLFDTLGLKSDKMRKKATGYSTNHEVLESLMDEHEIVPLIVEHRELTKLKGTYLDALPPLVNPDTGRIHTSFNQAVAATGRLSSQDPNLQNIPIRSELGRQIRRAFVAGEGKVLVSADYSQIELRILAHLSGDPVLVHAFQNHIDVHTQTAAEVFGIALDQVGADERRVAKAVNYGLVYGQSQFGLARALAIPVGDAKQYIARYFERFSRVREFMNDVIAEARVAGAVTTILGRRRPLGDLRSKNFQRRQAAERMAKNTPMQGSAADLMKLAMLKVAARMAQESYDAAMLLTVHDELVFEVAENQAGDFGAMAREEMERAYQLSVPLEVTVGVARSWADAH